MPVNILATDTNRACDFHRDYLEKGMFPLDTTRQTIIVYGCDTEHLNSDVTELIRTVEQPILVHCSDETRLHRTGYYATARAVIRSYFDPRITGANVWFVPIGYLNGYANDGEEPGHDRPISWTFIGQPTKTHRGEMLGQLATIGASFLHLTTGWMSADGLSPAMVIELYRQTIFVPCPFGNTHPDSLRISEALEWGCLPVTVKFMGTDYFRAIFGDHPFIVGNDWADAASQMRAMLEDRPALAELQARTAAWYRTFKENLVLDLADILDGRTASLRSPQWAYQRAAQKNPGLRATYALHFGQGSIARGYRLAIHKMRAFTSRYA
ncbi:MAG: hypothetical protein NVS3B27_08970 [Novosphingobium sp.]